MRFTNIITFWFNELTPTDWWKKSSELDQQIAKRFTTTHQQASAGELYAWRASAEGKLAEILVLDQFSRNIFRNDSRSFAYDAQALVLAQEAVSQGADLKLEPRQRAFLYMPYMHSESAIIHQQAIELFSHPEMANNLDFEKKHKVIIDRFGRYPHRNAILKRTSTPEELAFLKQKGSSF